MHCVLRFTVWFTVRVVHRLSSLHFVGDNRVIKDNLSLFPPLFRTIKETVVPIGMKCIRYSIWDIVWKYISPEHAEQVIEISKSFNIDAQIIGRIEESNGSKELIIKSEFGEFKY